MVDLRLQGRRGDSLGTVGWTRIKFVAKSVPQLAPKGSNLDPKGTIFSPLDNMLAPWGLPWDHFELTLGCLVRLFGDKSEESEILLF